MWSIMPAPKSCEYSTNATLHYPGSGEIQLNKLLKVKYNFLIKVSASRDISDILVRLSPKLMET